MFADSGIISRFMCGAHQAEGQSVVDSQKTFAGFVRRENCEEDAMSSLTSWTALSWPSGEGYRFLAQEVAHFKSWFYYTDSTC